MLFIVDLEPSVLKRVCTSQRKNTVSSGTSFAIVGIVTQIGEGYSKVCVVQARTNRLLTCLESATVNLKASSMI